jgi:DNA-binding transcriptional LysR family regulator
VDIRQLRQFVAVAEELSFRKAAKRLHIAQPPLTAAIQKIEEEVGAVLLERTNKVSRLTDAGQVFLEEARRTIEQLERAIFLAKEAEKGKKRIFRLSFVDSTINALVSNILRQFCVVHPNVSFHLLESTTAEQVRALQEDRVDAGILVLPIDKNGIQTKTLLRDHMVAAVSETHPLAKRNQIALRDLANEAWILFPTHPVNAEILKACAKAGFSPRIQQRARHAQTIAGLVACGIGVALLPSLFASAKPSGVVFLDFSGPPIIYEVALAYRNSSEILREFLRIAEKTRSHRNDCR